MSRPGTSGYYYVKVATQMEEIAYYDSEKEILYTVGNEHEFRSDDISFIGLRVPSRTEWEEMTKRIVSDDFKDMDSIKPELRTPIPFDWEVYKYGGWQAVTKNGLVISGLYLSSRSKTHILEDINNNVWTINGCYVDSEYKSQYDLLMYKI